MKTDRYLAILGRQPELGLLELESVFGAAAVEPHGAMVVVASDLELARFGGIEKYGRLVTVIDGTPNLAALLARPEFASAVVPSAPADGKVVFGLSVYGRNLLSRDLAASGAQIKRLLAVHGRSSRFIMPPPGRQAVSAAQIKFNRLFERGFELIIAYAGNRTFVAVTTQVQDIDAYAARDHGRPARSAKVGMLPPKLAQVMINTTTDGTAVYDPFCGTGVVLQEAALAGRAVGGSDLSPEMVAASQTNLRWLAGIASRAVIGLRNAPAADQSSLATDTSGDNLAAVITIADARKVVLPVAPAGLAIVSEGYLGPNLSTPPSPARRRELEAELMPLYMDALANLARQLPAGAELTLTVPAWRHERTWQPLPLVDELPRLGYTMKVFTHVPQPVLYARPDQIVGRQLLVLRKR